MNNRVLAFALFFSLMLSSYGDTLKSLRVIMPNGRAEYALKDVGSIKFMGDMMLVNRKVGGCDSWDVTQINSLTFLDDISGMTSVSGCGADYLRLDGESSVSYSFTENTVVRIYNVHGRLVDSLDCSGNGILNLTAYGKGVFLVYAAGRTLKVINQ